MAIGVLIALGGAVGGVALASGGSSRSDRGGSRSAGLHSPIVRRAWRHRWVVSGRPRPLPTALVRSFRVIRRTSRARAWSPAGPAGRFPGVPVDLVSGWGLAVGDAPAIANSIGLNLWLVPGNSGTCFAWTKPGAKFAGGGGDCVPNRLALAGAFSPIMGGLDGVTVIGLAPNGNKTVTLTLADGSSESVPVSHNVYVAKAPHGFKTVTLKDATGTLGSHRVPDGP